MQRVGTGKIVLALFCGGSAAFRSGLIDIVRVAISQQPQIKFLDRATERPLPSPSAGQIIKGRRPPDRDREQEHPRDAVAVRQKKRRPKED